MRKNQWLCCLLAAGMAWTPLSSWASAPAEAYPVMKAVDDNKVVKGTVSDADGPLIGASVKVVGKETGTITDLDGNFTLTCDEGDMLEISYVGYKKVVLKAADGMQVLL